jgi:hypothetical protein
MPLKICCLLALKLRRNKIEKLLNQSLPFIRNLSKKLSNSMVEKQETKKEKKSMTLIISESKDLKLNSISKCINKNQIFKLFGTLCFMIFEMSICLSLVLNARGL